MSAPATQLSLLPALTVIGVHPRVLASPRASPGRAWYSKAERRVDRHGPREAADVPIDFFAGTRLTPPRQVRAAWLVHLLISRGVTMEGTLRRHPAAPEACTAEAATTFCPLPLSAARIAGGFWAAAHQRVDAVRDCVAVDRGPLVYCLEQADHPAGILIDDIHLVNGDGTAVWRPDLLGGVTAIELTGRTTSGGAPLYQPRPADDVQPGRLARLTAIPYFAWANRGPGPMRMWIPAEPPG